MMKNSKFFAVSSVAVFALPLIAHAAITPTPTERGSQKQANGAICLRLENATGAMRTRLLEHKERWDSRKTERMANFAEKSENLADKLEQRRTASDDAREDNLEKLREKYADPEDQAAIDAFQEAVEAAVRDRREAFDAAHLAFRDGVATALAKRQELVRTALTAMQTAIQNAIADAKEACAAGEATETIRTNLRAAIQSAREEFKTARKSSDKVSAELENLRNSRKTAVKEAQDEFHEALEAAKENLKASLGEDEQNESQAN